MYTHELYASIDQVDAQEWDRLHKPEADLFMDRRFIRVMERSASDRARFWHVVVRDDRQQPVATACLYCYLVDLRLLTQGWPKRAIGLSRRVSPGLGQRKVVFCGLPIPAGQSSLRIAPEANAAEVLRLLDRLLVSIAKQEGARLIVLMEFTPEEDRRLASLESLGYLRAGSHPMNFAPAGFRDFDHFCASLNARRRHPITLLRKKFAQAGLRVVHRRGFEGVDQIYTDEVHCLFTEVAEPKKRIHEIPARFFRELAAQMPEESVFTFIYDADRVVAFGVSLGISSQYHALFVGFDHQLNSKCRLYFNLLFQMVDYGLRQNVREIYVGQGTDTFKLQRLRAYQRPLYAYVKSLTWLGSRVARYVVRKHFPAESKQAACADADPN